MDGWHSSNEKFSIAVEGKLEQAKSDMETALGKHIESLVREGQRARSEHPA
jgi:hypothetical protein